MYLDPLNDWLTRTGVGIIAHFQIISSFFLKVSVGAHPSYENEISFTCKLNSFDMNGCAPGLALITRLRSTLNLAVCNLSFATTRSPDRLDYQPLFEKGARTPPPNSRLDA